MKIHELVITVATDDDPNRLFIIGMRSCGDTQDQCDHIPFKHVSDLETLKLALKQTLDAIP